MLWNIVVLMAVLYADMVLNKIFERFNRGGKGLKMIQLCLYFLFRYESLNACIHWVGEEEEGGGRRSCYTYIMLS